MIFVYLIIAILCLVFVQILNVKIQQSNSEKIYIEKRNSKFRDFTEENSAKVHDKTVPK
jgi:uncharacterized ion transporter superfamily protein YfcC